MSASADQPHACATSAASGYSERKVPPFPLPSLISWLLHHVWSLSEEYRVVQEIISYSKEKAALDHSKQALFFLDSKALALKRLCIRMPWVSAEHIDTLPTELGDQMGCAPECSQLPGSRDVHGEHAAILSRNCYTLLSSGLQLLLEPPGNPAMAPRMRSALECCCNTHVAPASIASTKAHCCSRVPG